MKAKIIPLPAILMLAVAIPVFPAAAANVEETKKNPTKATAVYAKVILPQKQPATGKHPTVESWIRKELAKRGKKQSRAVTSWVRLSEKGDESTAIWDGVLDGKGWGCPADGWIVERDPKKGAKVEFSGFTPFGAEAKGATLNAKTGSRTIAVINDGMAYVALHVGKRDLSKTPAK